MIIFAVILFQGFIFAVLLLMLRHFMKAHIAGAVGHLQQLNDELVKDQAELKRKNAVAQKEYETQMAKLQQEITVRQAQIREEGVKTVEEARARAMEERERIINEAVETREKMKQEVMAEMETKAIQFSKKLIQEFFSLKIHERVHESLVEEVLDGLGEVDLERFQIKSENAEIQTAEPLKPEIKKKLQQILKEKMKKEIPLKEEVDPALLGGVILKIGTFIIDGSLANRLQEAAVRMRKESARKFQSNS